MADFKHYFDEEMRYLLACGREYARDFPRAAQQLSIVETEDRDPSVQQLFESFAFLTARIRQRMDFQDDEMAGLLLEQVAPGLEGSLPGVSVVEFVPRPETSEIEALVARGSEVLALPQAGSPPIRFRTIRDGVLQALRIEDFRSSVAQDGQACLEFKLVSTNTVEMPRWPQELELFLNFDVPVTWALRHWLTRKVRRMELEINRSFCSSGLWITGAQNRNGYSLETTPTSHSLLDLRDFFCADVRFRFVTLHGLAVAVPPGTKCVGIRVIFNQPFPEMLPRERGTSGVHLNAVPVVNSYLQPSQPFRLETFRTEYPLHWGDSHDREVLETEPFIGSSQSDPTKKHPYQKLSSWRHPGRKLPESGWYSLHRNNHRAGLTKASIRVGHPDADWAFADEFLQGSIWCCDGDKPHEVLRPTDIDQPSTGIPSGLAVRGLVPPSPVFRPPPSVDYRWKLLSHFQQSLRDLAQTNNLQQTLRLLLWDPLEQKKSFIENISDLNITTGYDLLDATPRQITRIRLVLFDETIRSDSWERIGSLDVFASLVHRLFKDRIPLGTVLSLTLQILPVGLTLEHPA